MSKFWRAVLLVLVVAVHALSTVACDDTETPVPVPTAVATPAPTATPIPSEGIITEGAVEIIGDVAGEDAGRSAKALNWIESGMQILEKWNNGE